MTTCAQQNPKHRKNPKNEKTKVYIYITKNQRKERERRLLKYLPRKIKKIKKKRASKGTPPRRLKKKIEDVLQEIVQQLRPKIVRFRENE